MKLWQLKNPQTGENIGGLQPLPENWGPIFGMDGVKDRLGDLSWLGITDRCWVEVDAPDQIVDQKKVVENQIKYLLEQSLSMVDPNNITITKGQFAEWTEYRRKLQEIPFQPNYPHEIFWPTRPE